MTEVSVRSRNVAGCFLLEEELKDANFEGDFAVLTVDVFGDENGKDFRTKTIIKRIIDKGTNEVFDYSVASDIDCLCLNKGTKNIIRINNHFLVEVAKYNIYDEEMYREYRQIDLCNKDGEVEFVDRGVIPGSPKATKNDDLVVITNNDKQCLFSLSKCDIASQEYSIIDDIDGSEFLITDIVFPVEDPSNNDYLFFKINSSDQRISGVYSRNDKEFTKDIVSYPYILIKERKIEELKQSSEKAAEVKRRFISNRAIGF